MYKDLTKEEKSTLQKYAEKFNFYKYACFNAQTYYNRMVKRINTDDAPVAYIKRVFFFEEETPLLNRIFELAKSDKIEKAIKAENKKNNILLDNIDREIMNWNEVFAYLKDKFKHVGKYGVFPLLKQSSIRLCAMAIDGRYYPHRIYANVKISRPVDAKQVYYRTTYGNAVKAHYDKFYKDEIEAIEIDLEKCENIH